MSAAGWVRSPAWDLGFFFGGSALALGVGVAVLMKPTLLLPAVVLWLLLIDGPHFAGTWLRAVADPVSRAAFRRPIAVGWAWLASGLVALGVATAAGERGLFDLYLLFGTIWGFHHFIRQNHGILSLLHRQRGRDPVGFRLDAKLAYTLQWGLIGLSLLAHPINRWAVGRGPAGPQEREIFATVGVVLVIAAALWAVDLALRARAGRPWLPGLFALGPVCGLYAFGLGVVGPAEPVALDPANLEQQLLATQLVLAIVHGVQYLGLGLVVGERRWAGGGGAWAGWLQARPARAYAALVAVSALYVGLNGLRGGVAGWAVLPSGGSAESAFLAVYWGILLHHYYLDQHLWRPHRDERLRAELGL